MDTFVQELANILGLDYVAVESTAYTLGALLVLYLLRLLWAASKRDDKQIDLEHTLANLAVNAINSHAETTKITQEISDVLTQLNSSFTDMIKDVKDVVIEVKDINETNKQDRPILNQIKDNLVKTSTTEVIVKDVEDNVLAKFVASPNEEGQFIIRFKSTVEGDV